MLRALMTVEVARRVEEAEDIAVFELRDPSGADLPTFSAGAHIDVEIAPGLVRQYSLCNNPEERKRFVIGVLKDPFSRGGSTAMHAIQTGARIQISEPRNHFSLEPTAGRTLLLAGGIGITPILCMAERLSKIGAEFEMHYCSRSSARTAFRGRIQASAFASQVHFHFDDGPEQDKLDIDRALGLLEHDTHVYVCGPSGFIDFVVNAAHARGLADGNLHREYFNIESTADLQEGAPFQVKLASTGQVFDIGIEATVIDVLREHGIELPCSCQVGVCGTCLTRVLEGVPDHRDRYLTDAEHRKGDQFVPCCSRSKSPLLVLDL